MPRWRERFAGIFFLAGVQAILEAPKLEPPDPIVRDGDLVKFTGSNIESLGEYNKDKEFVLHENVEIIFQPVEETFDDPPTCSDLTIEETDPLYPQQAALDYPYFLQCTVSGIKEGVEYDLRILYDIPGVDKYQPCESDLEENIDLMSLDDDWIVAPTGNNGVSTCYSIRGIAADEMTREELLAEVRSKEDNDEQRAGNPKITSVIPNKGSILGQQLITIAGNNLGSKKLNIPGANADESSPDGDDYILWFEKAGETPKFCVFDRQLTLLARHLGSQEFILCRTPAVHREGLWKMKLIIDGGAIINGPDFRFEVGHGPTITWATPYFSSPAAHPEEKYLEERSFWSMWIDLDTNNDGNEDERFYSHHRYKKLYLAGACRSPLDWEVFDKNNNKTFVQSVNFNSDGLPRAQTFNLKDGFHCSDSAQTETLNEIEMCPDVKIRYLCSENAIDFQGRLYTTNFDSIDDGDDEDPNRMFFQPRFISEDGLNMGECDISIKKDESSEIELFRRITNGDNGILRCLANVQEPGQYNFTFTSQNQGTAVNSQNFNNVLGNANLDPYNFEVYPMIRSIYPNVGSAEGGTVITITGTGFASTLGETTVELGGKPCEVLTHSATRITCRTSKVETHKRKFNWGTMPEGTNDCRGNDIFGSHWVPNQVSCRLHCEEEARCNHYIYNPHDGACYLKNGTPNCAYYAGLDHLLGEIALDMDTTNAVKTTRCIWGKGVGYQGTLSVDKNGNDCQPGTFCRNEDGLYATPSCNSTASNTIVECEIINCARIGEFSGSRGSTVRYSSNHKAYTYGHIAFMTEYEGANFEIIDSSYFSGSERWKWTGQFNREWYSARNQFYFHPPQTGWYRMIFSHDDDAQVLRFNEDGSFEKLYQSNSWSDLFAYAARGHTQQTKDLYMVEGTKELFEYSFQEDKGGDHASIGLQWLGDFKNGRYEDDTQTRLGYFKAHSRRGYRTTGTSQSHNLIFRMNYTGLDWEGEIPIPEERILNAPIFRLMYCGDNVNGVPNCRITRNMATAMWQFNSNSDREKRIEAVMRTDIFRNKIEYTSNPPTGDYSNWNNIKQYTGYEDNSIWPGSNHHKMEFGQFKGSKAFRTRPGYHIYNYGKGYLQYNGDDEVEMAKTIKHWCGGIKGGVSFLQAKLNFHYFNAQGEHKHYNNWWWMADDDNIASQYTSTNDGRDWGYHCFNLPDILDTQAGNKGITIDWMNDVFLTEIKMWAREDDRNDPDPDRKYRFMNTVLDETVFGDYGFERPDARIIDHAVQVDGKVIYNVDAKITKGGDHSVVLTYSATNVNQCSFSVPLPMVVEPDPTELFEKGLDGVDHVGNGKNQTMEFITETGYEVLYEHPAEIADYAVQLGREGASVFKTIVDIKYSGYYYRWDTPVDGTRMRYDAYAVERTVNSENVAPEVTTTVSFGIDDGSETYSFKHSTSQSTIQSEMRSRWPHLEKMNLQVTKHGDCKIGYYFEFKGHSRGNIGDLKAEHSVSDEFVKRNPDVAAALYEIKNDFWQGGPYQSIIPGSMMSIPKTIPEVAVITNRQRSKCGAHYREEMREDTWTDNMLHGCSFTFSEDLTPIVYGSSVQEGDLLAEGDTITVDVIFPGDLQVSSESYVDIGGSRCEIISYEDTVVGPINGTSAATRMTVIVGEVPAGEKTLTFTDPSYGTAKSEIKVNSVLVIDSYSPDSGSIYGGSIVTVSGKGFEEGLVVQVFDTLQNCIAIDGEVSYTEMKCVTQPVKDSSGRKQRQTSNESTPMIAEMSRTKLSVLGGDIVTITGSSFGSTANGSSVDVQGLFAETVCVPDPKYVQRGCLGYRTANSGDWEIISWSDTKIVAETAMLDQGDYELQITSAENGFSNKFNFTYAVEVTGISPRYSSLVGGRMVTISGFGFASDNITPNSKLNADTTVEVFAVGGLSGIWRNRCHVKEVSATKIVCETGYAINEPILMSTGGNFENITIKAGEAIRFKWSFTVDGKAPNMQFQECDEPNCEEASSADKIWGPKIKQSTGDFVRLFQTPGTYYYSTGYIDNAFSVWLNGVIFVEEAEERPEWLEVIVTDSFSDRQWGEVNEKWPHIASHVGTPPVLDGSDDGASELGSCTATTTNTVTAFEGELEKHSIIYTWAFTPVVDHWASNSALTPFMEANLTITNFDVSGDCSSQTQFAAVERYGPEIRPKNFFFKASAAISGTYTIDHNNMMDPLMEYEFDFVLAGRGRAYYNSYDGSAKFKIKPVSTFVSSTSVGVKGGWQLTIAGAGFIAPDKPLLETDNVIAIETEIHLGKDPAYRCNISSLSYTEIICEAPEIWRGIADRQENLGIYFRHDNDFYNVDNSFDINEIPVFANFDATPQITSVLPESGISHDTAQITFQGANLEGAKIMVGGQMLTGCSGDDTSQTCESPILAAGSYEISGSADNGIIYVAPHVSVNALFIAESMAPVSGSVWGGQHVTIAGYGWSEDISITVTQNGGIICSRCPITSIDEDVVFSMPSGKTTGLASIEVKHEFIDHDSFKFYFDYVEIGSGSPTALSDVSALSVGDSVSLALPAGTCSSSLRVDLVLNMSPCAEGAHNCHYAAECTPNEDGIQYTCACQGIYRGDGFSCAKFDIKSSQVLSSVTESTCFLAGNNFIWNLAKFESLEEVTNVLSTESGNIFLNIKYSASENSLTHDMDGTRVAWVDQVTLPAEDSCLVYHTGSASLNFVPCSNSHQIACESYDEEDCFSALGQYYKGDLDHSEGFTCVNWADVPSIPGATTEANLDLSGNSCRNPDKRSQGPFCYISTEIEEDEIEPAWIQCAVPNCAMKDQQVCQVVTESGAIIGRTHNSYILQSNFDGFYGNRKTIQTGFAEFDDGFAIFKFLNDKNPSSNHECWEVKDGDASDGDRPVITVSRPLANCKRWQKQLQPDGRYRLSQGNFYMRENFVGRDRIQGQLLTGLLYDDDTISGMTFDLQCSSPGDHRQSAVNPIEIFHELSGTCSGDLLTVSMPATPSGSYSLRVRDSENGYFPGKIDIAFSLSLDTISPSTIGQSGGQPITLSGEGFSTDSSTVSVDGVECAVQTVNTEGTELTCIFEDLGHIVESGDVVVQVSVTDKSTGSVISAETTVFIDITLTPIVTGFSPTRGGSAGGTRITFTGTNLDAGDEAIVSIHGVVCITLSRTASELVCETEPYSGLNIPVQPKIEFVNFGNSLFASEDLEFWYIDRWSSTFTWGCTDGSCKPMAGDIVVVPEGKVLLLDESTPILAVLIVDGGTVLWDRVHGLELSAEYAIVTNGGHFEIGNEDEPFCDPSGDRSIPFDATITMYGHQRSIELPIYGAKVFAVRRGTIDLHGCRVHTSWTHMDETAEVGENTIKLPHPVADDWVVGDQIIIATTGDLMKLHHSETAFISEVSADGYTLTLNDTLRFRHMAQCSDGFDWAGTICNRAEVGLLSKNVLFQGNRNLDWVEELDECELGIGTAFGVQTCFQNRFGHEVGSDQLGAHLMLHMVDSARIQFVEFNFVGQAFRLGRYPIHFHMTGDVAHTNTYVRGNSIHETFNRAVTMHGVHNLLVEYNVAFNVMGLTYFLEDGIEEDCIVQYNLAVMTKKSSSLLNIDSIPSSFWIPNPNNIIRHNAVAGSTHFGYWFNSPKHPTGPSATNSICCKNRPLGEFWNNTVHSSGKYGLWVFVDLTPTGPNGDCGEGAPKALKIGEIPEDAVMPEGVDRNSVYGLHTWNNERGAEITTGGAVQFHNFIASDNAIAGLAGKETYLGSFGVCPGVDCPGNVQAFVRSIVIGRMKHDSHVNSCGSMGIETPWEKFAFTVHDIHFFNFDAPGRGACTAVNPCYGSDAFDCGATCWYTDVRWTNSPRKITTDWEHEYAIRDIDGSFTENGGEEVYVVPRSAAYDPDHCTTVWPGPDGSNAKFVGRGVQICPYQDGVFKPHRFPFNNISPPALEGTNSHAISPYGTTKSPFRVCRPRGRGWMMLLNQGQEHVLQWNGYEHVTNISYSADMFYLEKDDYLHLAHEFYQRIDYTNLGKKLNVIPSISNLSHGNLDYHITSDEEFLSSRQYKLTYMLMGNRNPTMSSTKGIYPEKYEVDGRGDGTHGMKRTWSMKMYKCFYPNCEKPTTTTQPPTTTTTEPLIVCEIGEPGCEETYIIPGWDGNNETNVFVSEKRVIRLSTIPEELKDPERPNVLKATKILVDGELIIENIEEDLEIEIESFIVNSGISETTWGRGRRALIDQFTGKLVIGTAENPIPCDKTVTIRLMGNVSTAEEFGALGNSIPLGAKSLGGYGSVEMHGCPRDKTWTYLATTVQPGESTITLSEDADWKVGEEIAIASSNFDQAEVEFFSITAKEARTYTLNQTVQFRHFGIDTNLADADGKHLGAPVMLLTRNIVLDGSDGANGQVGGRVLIASTIEKDGGDTIFRSGYGQFSYVQFKQMGQFGYNANTDPRFQLAYYKINPTASGDRKQSYVRGCSFFHGLATAIGSGIGVNGLEMKDNVIVGAPEDGIRVLGEDAVIENNAIASIWERSAWAKINSGNSDFDSAQIPAGIDFKHAKQLTMKNNHIAGVMGPCFHGYGQTCTGDLEECTSDVYETDPNVVGNVGSGCLIGYYILKQPLGRCQKVSGFFLHHTTTAVYFQSTSQRLVVSDNVLVDNSVALYTVHAGPNAESKRYDPKASVTYKNNIIVGRSEHWQCGVDNEQSQILGLSGEFAPGTSSPKDHAAMVGTDFLSAYNKFPGKPMYKAFVKTPAIYGRTCVVANAFTKFDGRCGNRDVIFSSNKKMEDYSHPTYFKEGNTFDSNVASLSKVAKFFRPTTAFVNIADCVDLHCDGHKKQMIIDETGALLGTPGFLHSESEYKWEGVTRNWHTYTDTRPGLGDYRIPKPMLTTLDGDRIPVEDYAPEKGVIRDENCVYEPSIPGWHCTDSLQMIMMNYQFMDVDHMVRRVAPLAIRSETGYIDIINGPADHSCCIGYACMIRLSTFWSHQACNLHYDYYFTSTIPKRMNFHLPDYNNQKCKIYITFYTQKPNRIDVKQDGIYMIPTNARYIGDEIEWERPRREIHLPSLDGANNAPGTNFFDRQEQSVHMILETGHIYGLQLKSTLILELDVMTELTNDEFYDNGNIAVNIAALLGISPSRIKIVNVIRETNDERQKRRKASGWHYFGNPRLRRAGNVESSSLQFEIASNDKRPEDGDNELDEEDLAKEKEEIAALNELGADLAKRSLDDKNPLGAAVATAVVEQDPTVSVGEVAVGMADPPTISEDLPEWFDEENPVGVSIIQKLGLDEEAIGVGDAGSIDFDSLRDQILAVSDGEIDLETTKTAEEVANEKQAAKDTAAQAIVYKIPTTMILDEEPSGIQIEEVDIKSFVLHVLDQNDEMLTVVGFPLNPATVVVSLRDGESGEILGLDRVPFEPGTGYATFDAFQVTNTDKSVEFEFNIDFPAEFDLNATVPAVLSSTHDFLAKTTTGENETCEVIEGEGFDLQEIWNSNCSVICTLPCEDAGGLLSTSPKCHSRETTECGPYGSCTEETGCVCDFESMPEPDQINIDDHVHLSCNSRDEMVVKADKCLMHRLGFKLEDLSINGINPTDPLQPSGLNTCVGKLDYETGTDYKFTLYGDEACRMQKTSNATHDVYTNAIFGSIFQGENGFIQTVEVFSEFSCAFEETGLLLLDDFATCLNPSV